jgi:phage terminase large subunit-like protein
MTTELVRSKPKLMGATHPRLHTPWLKGETRGGEIAELARRIGQPLISWQELILNDMSVIDEDGMFIKKSSLFTCARQSGKSHMMRMRMLAGLFCFGEENILMMSSQRKMAIRSLEIMVLIVEKNDFLLKQVKGGKIDTAWRRTTGNEGLHLENGNRMEVVAANSDSARGLTADVLWIDELREVSEAAMDASKSTTLTRPNSQRFYTSNAGTVESEVLLNMRERSLNKPPRSLGFYEYSAPENCEIWDRNAWAMANPSLGILISEEAIEETIATSTTVAARTETLCQYVNTGLTSPWTPGSWEDLADKDMIMNPGMTVMFAFDVDPHTRRSASLVAGALLPDGRIALQLLKTWESLIAVDELQIAVDIKKKCDEWHPRLVLHDSYTTAAIAERLRNSGVAVEACVGAQFYTACSTFKDAIDNKRVVHSPDQPELDQQMLNVASSSKDTGWRIVRKKSSGSVAGPIGMAMVVLHLSKPVSEAKVYS